MPFTLQLHRATPWVRATLLLSLFTGLVLFVITTLRWPILWDTSVMHYVRFLIDHGQQPYSQITDMNMPGTYLLEGLGMHLFGPGDLAWRLYDFFLCACLIAAMVVITLPYDWLAGALAGILFSLIHGSDGPMNAVERDEVMTVLLVIGYAFLFQSLRRRKPVLLAPFALFAGMAASIKPTVAPLAIALFVLSVLVTRRQQRPLVPVLLANLLGFAAATGIVLGFLLGHHALTAFVFILRDVLPHYAGVNPAPLSRIAYRILPPAILILVPAGLILSRRESAWSPSERWALLLGITFGAVSFLSQRKGYFYHRYPLLALTLLWLAVELCTALRRRTGFAQRLAAATLLFLALVVVPLFSYRILRTPTRDTFAVFSTTLEDDLSRVAATQPQGNLQHQVLCLDLVYGCLNALYHLGLIENTSSTGDLLYFLPSDAPVVLHYRALFWKSLQSRPPAVIVLSNEWYSQDATFAKVNAWPQFAHFLGNNYTLALQRTFSSEGPPIPNPPPDPKQPSYRIYLHR